MMFEEPLTNYKPTPCIMHKNQKVTHLCNELQCNSNPLLCHQCFTENMHSHYHSTHEKKIEPLQESVEKLANIIKTHINPLKKVFKNTLGKSQFSGILEHVEKSSIIFTELDDRVKAIKNQVDIELELMLKEFQKILIIEKQEYFKILDNYQRTFIRNIEYLRTQTQPLIDYQTTLKYYANRNNLFLKTLSEARKKSDWLSKSKKVMMSASKIVENNYYTTDILNLLANANKTRMDLLPTWKGEQNMDKGGQLRYLIKRALNQWVYIPDIRSLHEEENGRGFYSQTVLK